MIMIHGTCKTCKHWQVPHERDSLRATDICSPEDVDTGEPMERGFEVRMCKQPTQTRFESPVEINGFALTDSSTYYAALCTAENFGCVRHEKA